MDKPDKIWAEGGSYPDFRDDDWVHASASTNDDCGTPYLRATPERELASSLAWIVWQWLELAERTMEDHALRFDVNRAEDFWEGIRETKAVLAKLEQGDE